MAKRRSRSRGGWGLIPDPSIIIDDPSLAPPRITTKKKTPKKGTPKAPPKKKATAPGKPRAATPRQRSVTRRGGACTVSFTTKDGRHVSFKAACPPAPQGKWHCLSFKTVTNVRGNHVRRCKKYACD